MKTRFEVSFKAPQSTSSTVHYNVVASNSKAGKCVSQIGVPVNNAAGGSMVHVKLNPKNAGGKWCKGRFKGQVQEIIAVSCSCGPPVTSADRSGHAAVVCPVIPCPKAASADQAHPAAVSTQTIGTFSFRVRKRSTHHH